MTMAMLVLGLLTATELDRVTVTARHAVEARPEAVAVIDAAQIDVVAAIHPNELFGRVPGVWISRGSGQELLTAIRSPVLTGPGACGAFAILEDGVPIRPTAFCNVNNLFEAATEMAGSIEVLRGPGAVVLGSNALHGAIATTPRRPGEAPHRAVTVTAGPHGFRRISGTLADVDRDHAWRLDGYGVSTGSFRDGEGYDQQKLSLQWAVPTWSGSPSVLLSASNLNQETAGFITGRDAFRDRRRFDNQNPEAFRDAFALRVQGRWSWPLVGGWLEWVPYARHDAMRFLQHFTPGKPLEENDSRSAGSQLMWRFEGRWRGQAGFDVEHARGDLLEVQAQPLTDASPFQNAVRPAGRHYDYRVATRMLAGFAELERTVGVNTRLLAGARYERLRLAYDNRAGDGNLREDGTACGFGGCLFNRPADRRDRFDHASAQFGLHHGLDERWTVSARFARGFRFPQAGELYRLQRGQAVADLRPETLTGPELGLAYRDDRLALELHAYDYRKRNVILRDAQGFNISDGRTRHRGIEASVRWQGPAGLWLEGNAAYSDQRYRFDRAVAGGETIIAGNPIDTAPRWLAGTRIGLDSLTLGRFELEWRHQGGYFLDAGNTERYGGHDLLDLRWARPLSECVRLTARLANLGDRRFAERADLAFGEFRYFPGAGRELHIGVSWSR